MAVGVKSWHWTGLFFIETGVILPRRCFVVKPGVDTTAAITLSTDRKFISL